MRWCRLCLAALGLLAGAGCAGRGLPTRFVPTAAKAERALAAALDAWKEGQEPRSVDGAKVHVADTHRKPGQRLQRYVILGEVPGDGPRCFAVRLSLESPQEEARVRYVVFGLDPLWVYRHEDFLMLAHWECAGEVEATPPTRPPDTKAPDTKAAHHGEKNKP
jgi:hypothetical protein